MEECLSRAEFNQSALSVPSSINLLKIYPTSGVSTVGQKWLHFALSPSFGTSVTLMQTTILPRLNCAGTAVRPQLLINQYSS